MQYLQIYLLNNPTQVNKIQFKKPTFAQNSEMSDALILVEGDRATRYQSLIPQLKALISDETDLVANCANVSAALKQIFGFLWVGFYFVKADEMVLGPFQGDIACTRIQKGRGVCGTVWLKKETIIVPDVDQFDGHIACSSQSRSEIVVPIIKGGIVRSVIDVDSDQLNDFNEVDKKYLEEIALILNELF